MESPALLICNWPIFLFFIHCKNGSFKILSITCLKIIENLHLLVYVKIQVILLGKKNK